MLTRKFYIGALLTGLTLAASCGEDGPAARSDCDSSVERSRVLFTALSTASASLNRSVAQAEALSAAVNELGASTTDEHLEAAREELRRARIAMAQSGPYLLLYDEAGATLGAVGEFPVDTGAVLAYAREGSFDADAPADFDRGYAAIEFLLYGAEPTSALQHLQSNPERVVLAKAYADDAARRWRSVQTQWDASTREAILGTEGTAAGSGLSLLINSLSKHYEDTRRDRLGIPFGVTLGFPSASALEAPYSGRSLELLGTHLVASQLAFGKTSESRSLADYTAGLNNAEAGALAADIEAQYTAALEALTAIESPLARAIEDERGAVQVLYNAVSRQVINLKTDLPSVTCVSITYVDNPSDSD